MAEITVPRDQRPALWKYVVLTAIGFVVVGSFSALLTQNSADAIMGLFAFAVAALLNLGILFLMVQSLIEEWFDAAEVHDTSR